MQGWILKHRKILSHWIHPAQQGRKFTEYEAWDDLLFKASFEAKKEYYNGTLFDIAVGECIVSTNKLAERWKWTRRKVEKFLKLLESEQMISRSKFDEKNLKSSTRLIITNYEDLQLKTLTKSTTDSTSNDTTDDTLLNNIKNINKLSSAKKDKQPQNNPKITPNENVNVNEECKCINENENIFIQEFPNWYSAYPNKKSMEKAKQAFIKIRSAGATLEELTNGLNSYIKHINQNNTQKQYIKHPATWLNQGCWKDEYEVKEEAVYNAFA